MKGSGWCGVFVEGGRSGAWVACNGLWWWRGEKGGVLWEMGCFMGEDWGGSVEVVG